MREILFRGKAIAGFHTGKFVYGYLVKDFWHRGDCGIHPIDKTQGGYIEVNPETVGQYTGLTDKNGKKIFEGDILEFSDRLVIVFWHTHLGCWDCNFLKFTNKDNGRDDMSPLNWDYKSNVIGNIHNSLELLEGGTE